MSEAKPSSMRRRTGTPEAPEPEVDAAEKEEDVLACRACGFLLDDSDLFCAKCGTPVMARVIVELSDDDVRNFLFTGHISKSFKLFEDLLGEDCFKVEIRSVQDKDNRDIARHMSRYAAEQGGASRVLNEDFLGEKRIQQMARAVVSLNGTPMKTVDQAVEELSKHSENVLGLIQDHYNALARAIDGALASERRVKKL
jgi:hypothetical protein